MGLGRFEGGQTDSTVPEGVVRYLVPYSWLEVTLAYTCDVPASADKVIIPHCIPPFSRRYHTHDFHLPPPFRDAQHGRGRALAQCLALGADHPMLHYDASMFLSRPNDCVQLCVHLLQGLRRVLPVEQATGN